MLHSESPNCPIHVGARMKLVKSGEPLFNFTSIQSKRMNQSVRRKEADTRLIWRCPIPGCSRVEASDIVNPWERFELPGQK